MGTFIFIGTCLAGMYFCYYLLGKTIVWAFQPVIKHLEAKDNEEFKNHEYVYCVENEQDAELLHDHHLTIEDDNTIIQVSKIVMKKLKSRFIDNEWKGFRR